MKHLLVFIIIHLEKKRIGNFPILENFVTTLYNDTFLKNIKLSL